MESVNEGNVSILRQNDVPCFRNIWFSEAKIANYKVKLAENLNALECSSFPS